MKDLINKKILLLVSILFLINHMLYSQDEDDKWVVGVGINVVDIRTPNGIVGIVKDYGNGTIEDLNMYGGFFRAYVGRYLFEGISFQVAGSANKIKKGFGYSTGDPLLNDSFFALDAKFKYSIKYLLKKPADVFDPFVLMGGGYSKIGEDSNMNIGIGWGFNLWFTNSIGLNFQSDYNHNPVSSAKDYFQHSVGLVFKLSSSPKFGWRGR